MSPSVVIRLDLIRRKLPSHAHVLTDTDTDTDTYTYLQVGDVSISNDEEDIVGALACLPREQQDMLNRWREVGRSVQIHNLQVLEHVKALAKPLYTSSLRPHTLVA